MAKKTFSQQEINRIISMRLKREREQLTRDIEICFKRCMASIHLTLYQEMCALKRGMAAETEDTLLSGEKDTHPMPSKAAARRPNTQSGGDEK